MFRCFTTIAFACVVVRGLQARGASLVERHKVEPGKAKKAAGGKEGGKKTFTWSREEDFEQRKKFTPQVRNCFVFVSFVCFEWRLSQSSIVVYNSTKITVGGIFDGAHACAIYC